MAVPVGIGSTLFLIIGLGVIAILGIVIGCIWLLLNSENKKENGMK
ncbi:hypothetical protein [Rahnella ecdela]|uniref:Uncharacterized protein n=1 Tax=Rahnella ecdela TaxID=2816250 RepID=A0ABS6LBP6_9GAMM|nr:hypothetical protein [Rahnella ecdela]MBU9844360.1 hypothetical protein [Rahnella ecdela]